MTLVEAGTGCSAPRSPRRARSSPRCCAPTASTSAPGAEVARVEHDDGEFVLQVGGEEPVAPSSCWWPSGASPTSTTSGWRRSASAPDAEHLETDERLRAGERLWAVGDITGKGAFTHVSLYQAEVAVRDLLGEDGPAADYRAVSRVTFTDPEVGAVGLDRGAGPRRRAAACAVGHADIAQAARGWIDEAEGIVKVVADADRGVLVGGTVVAPYGGEVLGLLTAAVHAEIPVETLRGMHYAYPTFHRAIEAALATCDRPRDPARD